MTTLTEQYRNGELPSGWYYIRDEMYKVYPAQYIREYDYIKDKAYAEFPHADNLVVDVLCEVPSYESWKKHRKVTAETQIKNCDLEIINTKLKELLKECRFLLGKTPYENTSQYLTFSDVLNRVDQVLGE